MRDRQNFGPQCWWRNIFVLYCFPETNIRSFLDVEMKFDLLLLVIARLSNNSIISSELNLHNFNENMQWSAMMQSPFSNFSDNSLNFWGRDEYRTRSGIYGDDFYGNFPSRYRLRRVRFLTFISFMFSPDKNSLNFVWSDVVEHCQKWQKIR